MKPTICCDHGIFLTVKCPKCYPQRPPPDPDLSDTYSSKTTWKNYIGVAFLLGCLIIGGLLLLLNTFK